MRFIQRRFEEIVIVLLLAIIAIMLAGCARHGCGCHGPRGALKMHEVQGRKSVSIRMHIDRRELKP